jgi:cytochrome bd ubiquinol oxidase subunit I
MNKLKLNIIFLVIFVLLLAFVIAPLQGGLLLSSDILADLIENVDSQFQEILPIQEFFGNQGRSSLIASAMLGHILLANMALGGSWIVVFSERQYIKKGKERYDKIAHSLTLFMVILFSTGATFAVAGMLFFISLYPAFASQIFHIFWWPLLIEVFTFVFEIFFLYSYFFSWNKISRKWHQILGFGFAIDVFIQTGLINMVASAMLSPPDTGIVYTGSGLLVQSWGDLLSWWFNQTFGWLTMHRFVAAVSYFGFLLAILAMFHYNDQKDSLVNRAHWDWVGSYGLAWGLGALIVQPILGMVYAQVIENGQPDAFYFMMHGPRAWVMLLMVGLFSALFIALIIYFLDRREVILSKPENAFLHKTLKILLVIAIIAAVILVQPAWFGSDDINSPDAIINPLGKMSFKYIAFFVMIVIGVIILITDTRLLKDQREGEWGNLSSQSRYSAITIGILGMWIVVVMGFVRESIRTPWLINGIIPIPDSMSNPTPITMGKIFLVWTILTTTMLVIFWFVSKVTSYHPEKAEEI